MALSLSAAGATIALVARDAEKLSSVKTEIEAAGGSVAALSEVGGRRHPAGGADVAVLEQTSRLVVTTARAAVHLRVVEDLPASVLVFVLRLVGRRRRQIAAGTAGAAHNQQQPEGPAAPHHPLFTTQPGKIFNRPWCRRHPPAQP